MQSPKSKIKVLIVDDSAIVRKILSDAVNSQPDMEVIGTAPDPFVARDKILALEPDVITLDIEMPRMDGLTFLKKVMRFHPVPTIMVSSLGAASTTAALDALRFGAVDILAKPAGPYSVGELSNSIAERIRAAARSKRVKLPDAEPTHLQPSTLQKLDFRQDTVLAIGASTGGTVAIQTILRELPADIPGTVITQHIPAGFSLAFAKRLNETCSMEVREAVHGDTLHAGLALVAPGDFHLLLRRTGSRYSVELQQGPQVCYQRPSVDVMFASVAQAAREQAVGVLLTGMGTDGAKGLLLMKQAGAFTLAQDESTSTVYGMPREAARLGAVDRVVALGDVPSAIGEALRGFLRSERPSAEFRSHTSTPYLAIQGSYAMKGTILVVDDSAMMRKIVLRTLKMAEVEFEEVLEAGDGTEALALLRSHTVSLIMCDINMPNMSGLDLLKQMKQENLAVGVPVVMVTTEGSEPQVREAIMNGARGYIRKPFTLEHIKNNVKPLLVA